MFICSVYVRLGNLDHARLVLVEVLRRNLVLFAAHGVVLFDGRFVGTTGGERGVDGGLQGLLGSVSSK